MTTGGSDAMMTDSTSTHYLAIADQHPRDASVESSQTDSVELCILAGLTYEFHVIDRSAFPFRGLSAREVRVECGIDVSRPFEFKFHGFVRGNYVKGHALSALRKERKSNAYCFSDLSMIFNLPTEMIQEIFEHLHPVDLYNLVLTSKSIRGLLLDRRSSSIWSTVFDRHPDILPPPPDLSYPSWASLLFGPAICDTCGQHPAMVDFTFRERICFSCMDTHYWWTDGFEYLRDQLGSELDSIWTQKLVKGSHRWDSMVYPGEYDYSYSQKYCKRDVDALAAEMGVYRAAIKAGLPMAVENYEAFKSERIASVAASMEHIRQCNDWCSGIFTQLDVNYLDSTTPYLINKRWKRYLISLGYDPRDIHSIRSEVVHLLSCYPIHKTSKQIFRSFLPGIISLLAQEKAGRRLEEHRTQVKSRKQRVLELYYAVQRTMDPTTWSNHPECDDIYRIPSIWRYICDGDEPSAISDEDIKNSIQLYLDEGELYGRRQLLEAISKRELFSTHSSPEVLDLASAVFACPVHTFKDAPQQSWSALIGWDDAAHHQNCVVPGRMSKSRNIVGDDAGRPGFTFCAKSFELLKGLLDLLGLDIHMTSAGDVDSLPARFVCTNCPLTPARGGKGAHALSVKECLAHSLRNPADTMQSFKLLSDDFTKSVLAREKELPSMTTTSSWCCRHCPEHLETAKTRKDVVAHLKAKHSIYYPTHRTDLVQKVGADRMDHMDCFVIIDPPQNYICCACHDAKTKLWNLRALTSHLKDSHAIQTSRANIDWIQVELYAT